MTRRLADPEYLSFPLRVDAAGPRTVHRRDHIRQQIEQVLLTNPSERVFELEFGAGVRRMVFEPNETVLWDLAKQRLTASLTEALRGEVDPRSLDVTAEPEEEEGTLRIRIRYRLATINRPVEHVFVVEGGGVG